MKMYSVVFLLYFFSACYGGEWRNLTGVDDSKYYRVNDLSIPITSKNKLIVQVKQCKEAEVQLMEGDGRSWIYLRIGGGENEWAAMAASTNCDANGCYWVTYKYGNFLNCSEHQKFYFSWNNKGGIKVGKEEVVGENVMMDKNLGKEFTINYISVRSKSSTDKGDWLFLKDEAPFFTMPKPDGTEVVEVSETSVIGSTVLTFRGGDPEGDSLTYSVLTHKDVFTAEDSKLKTVALLNYEITQSYVISVNVFDGRNNVRASLTIKVTDSIDESPVLSTTNNVEIAEELETGTVLPRYFSVSDADENDSHTYELKGSDATFFNINSTTGEMSVRSRVDREGVSGRVSLDHLTVVVTDLNSLKATLDFKLTVLDINDNPPVFNTTTYTTTVTENTPADISLGEVYISDNDDGNNAVYTVNIAAGDDSESKFKFKGNMLMTDSTFTDYDNDEMKSKKYTYTLSVIAVDSPNEGQPLTSMATFIIYVKPENDNKPKWVKPAISGNNVFDDVAVDENQDALTLITTFTASDADSGADGVITYQLMSVKADDGSDGMNKVTLDGNTGELKTATVLDADVDTGGVSYYSVVVKAEDGGKSPQSATGTIKVFVGKVNDNVPVFSEKQYVVSLSEKTDVGTDVITLTATDNDAGDKITFSIDDASSSFFSVSGDLLKLKSALDFETKTVHVITASASDGVFNSTTVIIVQVKDASDEKLVITVTKPLVIPEEQAANTVLYGVYRLSYRDSFTYTLSGSGADEYLSIDSSTGLISLKTKIDRDDPNTGLRILDKVKLKVDDGAGSVAEAALTFTIEDINDNAPTVEKSVYHVEITENTQSDLLLVNFDVVDKDAGNNAKVVLNITDGNVNSVFRLEDTKLLADASRIDYDVIDTDVFTLTVTINDSPDTGTVLGTAALVIVKIIPKNEFTPVWVSPAFVNNSFQSVTLRETVLPETEVTVFSATDEDRGTDGTVQYSIESIKEYYKDTKVKEARDMFLMFSSTGTMMTAKGLDADTGITHYEIVVAAVDGGSIQRTVTGVITIKVQDEDDNNAGDTVDTAEIWVMRILLCLLAVGMIIMSLLFVKSLLTALGNLPARPPIRKVVPKVQLERPEAVDTHFKKGHIGYEISDYDDDLYL